MDGETNLKIKKALDETKGFTAESLVKEGKAAAVRDFLDHVATGGFA